MIAAQYVRTAIAVVGLGWALRASAEVPAPLPGFAAASVAAEREVEARFVAVPTSAGVDKTVRWLTRAPHLAGTPGNKAVADALATELRGLGLEVKVERYDVYLPHPKSAHVRLYAPNPVELPLREHHPSGLVPDDAPELWAWNAYSANGKARGQVVFAGLGRRADFDALEKAKIDLKGKVLLVRYGGTARSAKVALAEEHGAAAVLLYSDPASEGYAAGEVLPRGPQRPDDQVQRGTVAYMARYTGDPLTPGKPALPDVPRLAAKDAADLPRIPVVPIRASDAARILAALGGPFVGRDRQGALPLTYHYGPGPAEVEVEVEQDYATRPIWDVIATYPGQTSRRVILGVHFDAWVLGAVDPGSGTSAMMEIARGLARLKKSGWRPRRTIVLGFWDAEEPAVIGSTEWVEAHAAELRDDAVAYLNVDTINAGSIGATGSPSLRDVFESALRDVADPGTHRPFLEAWRSSQSAAWTTRWKGVPGAQRQPFATALDTLGTGTDFTAFFHWLGVPSMQWTMAGVGSYSIYHATVDDYEYARTWNDKDFLYTPAFARAMGLTALRLANADVVPIRYSLYADGIDRWLDGIESGNLDDQGAPRRPLSLEPLRKATRNFRDAALRVEQRVALAATAPSGGAALDAIDRALPLVERAFIVAGGVAGSTWYSHILDAPDPDDGYAGIALPEVAQAVTAGDATALDRAVGRLVATLQRAAQILDGALATTR